MTTITEWRNALGLRLRHFRKQAGLSQQGLARALSVDRSLVSRWESGSRDPGLWDIVQAALALGIPASELVNGRAQLPSGTQTIWKELAYRGAPFLVTDADPLWAVRPVQETVADALLHPDPRQVDRLPGLLLVEDFPPRALWGLCADHGVDRRLGWIADIARTLAQFGSVPVQPRATRSIDVVLELVARPAADSSWDTLGFGAERPESLPPPSRRWRISYDQSIEGFAEAAQELAADRAKRGAR